MNDFELKQELFEARLRSRIDPRIIAYHLRVESAGEKRRNAHPRKVKVNGFSYCPQTDQYIRTVAEEVFGKDTVKFDLKVLSRDCPLEFYQVIVPAAHFWKKPKVHAPDLRTQALYGSVIRGFFASGDYIFAQHPDGYCGYVPAEAVRACSVAQYLAWKNGRAAVLRKPLRSGKLTIPPTARLPYRSGKLQLADGKSVSVSKNAVIPVHHAAKGLVRRVKQFARVFEKTLYLWGGKTEAGIDCSGFMQSVFLQEHVLLPRDANMQAMVGEFVGYLPDYADLLPGDLLFFMNEKAHVYHVGMYVGARRYLHSSSKFNIDISSLDPSKEKFVAGYQNNFVFARRVHTLA